MRHTPRSGYTSAGRGLVATLIVAAASAGSVAAQGVDGLVDQGPSAGDVLASTPAAEAMDDSGFEEFGASAQIRTVDALPRYIVEVEDRTALEATLVDLAELGVEPIDVWDEALFGFVVALDPAGMERLRVLPDVTRIDPETIVTAASSQAGPPWGLDRIDQRSLPLDSGYAYGGIGAGVDLYVIDSGLRTSHTEFTGRVGDGAYWNFGDGTGISDCQGHGTHVAGIAGGTTYGVAKGVSVIPVKVFSCSGSTTDSIVVAGIDWIIADHAAGTPAVANMSLGGPPSDFLDSAVQAMIDDGITVVVAAGNDAEPTCDFSPARVPA
ncbi:MAG TPA: S8 family peptidase, partial [Ilumatobacteraceae bacterium]|nr:S8 family peptidase [Ilumatobacteraceae bacterium]